MQSQDGLTASQIRLVDDDLTVEAAGPQERLIEHLRTVRRRHDDDALRRVEAVHFGQELVQGLLPLVVAADEPGAARARLADRVELVDEDDARGLVLGLLEQVADARGADPDEHLDELRAGQGEERHVRLAGDSPRQERLTGARRADQQDAFRDPAAEPLVLLGVLQEVDDLDELRLGLVDSRDVAERGLELLAVEDLVLGAAERQGLRGPATDAPHQEHPDADHDAERDDPAEEKVAHERRLDTAGELDLVLLEIGNEGSLVHPGNARHGEHAYLGVGAEPLAQTVTGAAGRGCQGIRLRDAPDLLLGQGHLLDLVGPHELEELGHRNLDSAGGLEPGLEQEKDHRRDQHVGQRELDALVEPRPHRCPHSSC